jgi:hypothetical protein
LLIYINSGNSLAALNHQGWGLPSSLWSNPPQTQALTLAVSTGFSRMLEIGFSQVIPSPVHRGAS